MKLYFENRNQLVAKTDVIDVAKRQVLFTIVNGELLDKLKNDKLYIMLTGIRPNKKAKMKLLWTIKPK